MITIEFPYRKDDPKSINIENVPEALIRAIHEAYLEYPNVKNQGENMRFDKLFSKLYNCRIEYNKDHGIASITWDDDRDYTLFLLKWT